MSDEPVQPGAKRRAMMRVVLGKPGSVRRWLLGSLVFVFLCSLLFVRLEFVGRIAVFIFAAFVIMAAFRFRSLAIGDEDELRAWLRHRAPAPEPDKFVHASDSEAWLEKSELGLGRFHDAPTPPILDGPDPDDPVEPQSLSRASDEQEHRHV